MAAFVVSLQKQFLGSPSAGLSFSSSFRNDICTVPTVEEDVITMAVPKKRKSKAKTAMTKAGWFRQGKFAAERALNLYASLATGKSSFVDDGRFKKLKREVDRVLQEDAKDEGF
eukprot:CAMPEP_0184656304 /NCGR_PEP_ID=MMETSP0308-20130426/16272_1 /TAXON_ID=38269 /ORGANISM="Gloeochaete witrockiana, Strain SAG 46.84" /LENGTH=113 /DNA_ID=CAMNT_0027093359 /DNA_START=57 /DNA_END=398 /DNA_ORIENTATION=+